MVMRELLRELSNCLGENGGFEARELLMHVTGMNLTEITLDRNSEISSETEKQARKLADRRRSGEPLQYIIGMAEFMGLEFEVNPYTLIPRQDTETLVEAVINRSADGAKALDIGTGSGCIGISLAHFIKDAEVTLADISAGALETAKRNAVKNGVKVKCLEMDILKEIPDGSFDIIVSNPPYIRSGVVPTLDTDVKDHEPLSALDGGVDGLKFYRRITQIAPELLNDGGILAYEIGYDQGEAVEKMVKKALGNARIIKDCCGNDRVVIARKTNV